MKMTDLLLHCEIDDFVLLFRQDMAFALPILHSN